jgi:ethylbenzene dioxygenase beta subunit
MNAPTPINIQPERAGDAIRKDVESFLLLEARLLDMERWSEWLQLLTEDIHYWMPSVENRRRSDRLGAWEQGRGAYYDDSYEDLARRVARFRQTSAWAEDPPTRHVHLISSIEAFASDRADEFMVYSAFVNYRSRGEADNDLLIGRREDTLRMTASGLKLARRKIYITQSLFLSKNLNTFL